MMKLNKLFALFAVLLLVCALALPAFAHGDEDHGDDHDHGSDDHDDEHDSYEDNVDRRRADVEVKSDGIEVRLESEVAGVEDSLRFGLRLDDDGFRVKFDYERETDELETSVGFKFRAYRIVEFEGSERLDSNAVVVSSYVLGSAGWNDLTPLTTVENGLKQASISTSDGIFTINAFIAESILSRNGTDGLTTVRYSPNTIKMDFIIEDYPYETLSTSRLALEVRLVTFSENDHVEENEDSTGEDSKRVRVGAPTTTAVVGLFDWLGSAVVDDTQIDVVSSTMRALEPSEDDDDELEDDEDEKMMSFTFATDANPARIVWDPTLGAGYTNAELSSSGSFQASATVGALVGFAVLALMA